MQLSLHPTMDCSGRSNNIERDSDLGDDLSHGDRTDDEMRDCDSVDGEHHQHQLRGKAAIAARLSHTIATNGGSLNFAHSPEQQAELPLSHHHQLPPNHPFNALGSFMSIGGLHSIPNLQHSDVLEKLKMQVRDMKVGLMDYAAAAHAAAFGANMLPTTINSAFPLPHNSVVAAAAASFGHGHATSGLGTTSSTNGSTAATNGYNGGSAASITASGGGGGGNHGSNNTNNNNNSSSSNNNNTGGNSNANANAHPFSFASPTAPSAKDANSASNSSTSSEASNSSQQNNGWSFEEQYKQVRQLYEINDDPKRKEFLDDLFSFMQKRGTPINRLPIMAKSVLDLYELYNLVIARGGLVDVINKKLWQEIIKGLHLPSSITSAAFTLRTQYMKYLYPYECEKKNLSTPAELQAAIDGNRREGRRSSYGQYEAMHNQMPLTPISRPPLPGGMQQMSPLALVTHAAAANNQQAQAAAAAAAAHRRLMGAPAFGQMPNLVTQEIENRMMEYLQLIQAKKEQGVGGNQGPGALAATPHHQQQQQQQQQHQQQRQRSQSPEMSTREALSAQVALWHMYHNNTSPPNSAHTSPQFGVNAEQQREALNLSDSPPNLTNIKRERERDPTPEPIEEDAPHQPPPAKRVGVGNTLMPPGFPANFYLNPHNMAAVAAAAGFHHQANSHQPDAASEGEPEDEYGSGEHNTTGNSSSLHDDSEPQQLNGHHSNHHHHHHHHHNNHLDKSDDSAIENSPSTSTSASGGNRHSSPVSTKKKTVGKTQSLSKDLQADKCAASKLSPLETLSLLSGMQFQVARNGTGENGEQQLIVNLELNGIKYSGVLVANVASHDDNEASTGPADEDATAPATAEEPSLDGATATAATASALESTPASGDEPTGEPIKTEQSDSNAILNGAATVGVGVGVGLPLLKDAVVSS
ncbi:protein dead ringer isoform X2 [Scaptodrosophila lebanonensis]|uniref:Protein dead ringer isoform X2 n=1 Tax=Drosophila lebanonensis TaxID=7225 RepID=A0A6J2UDK7_DROLE|nr:protein dead ringer isoform X2 [Scaptodrosophila lebanonensis]